MHFGGVCPRPIRKWPSATLVENIKRNLLADSALSRWRLTNDHRTVTLTAYRHWYVPDPELWHLTGNRPQKADRSGVLASFLSSYWLDAVLCAQPANPFWTSGIPLIYCTAADWLVGARRHTRSVSNLFSQPSWRSLSSLSFAPSFRESD